MCMVFSLSCVQLLLAYGADPYATEWFPPAETTAQRHPVVRRMTAVDVASSYPLVVEALQAARLAANARARAEVDVMVTPDTP